MTVKDLPPRRSILVINPNTTHSMTQTLEPLIENLDIERTTFPTFTAPSGVPSINNEDDALVSATHCLPYLKPQLPHHDGFLVACYSAHPLVNQLRSALIEAGESNKPVTGIFEASVATCLQLTSSPGGQFGIVSTGAQWSEILDDAVAALLGTKTSGRYAGTETTGLTAVELHTTPKEEVDRMISEATKRLLGKGDVRAICLGCAGMAGMDETVRKACVEALGEEGRRVRVVDGVVSGVNFIEGALRAGH